MMRRWRSVGQGPMAASYSMWPWGGRGWEWGGEVFSRKVTNLLDGVEGAALESLYFVHEVLLLSSIILPVRVTHLW